MKNNKEQDIDRHYYYFMVGKLKLPWLLKRHLKRNYLWQPRLFKAIFGVIIDAADVEKFEAWLKTKVNQNSYIEVAYREKYNQVLIENGKLVKRPKLPDDKVFVCKLKDNNLCKEQVTPENIEKLRKLRDDYLSTQEIEILKERNEWWGVCTGFWHNTFLRTTAETVTKEIVQDALLEKDPGLMDISSILEPFYRTAQNIDEIMANLNDSQKTVYFIANKCWIIIDEGIEQFDNESVYQVITAFKEVNANKTASVLEEYIAWGKKLGIELDDIQYEDSYIDNLREISKRFSEAWESDNVELKVKEFITNHFDDFVYHDK